MLLKLLVERYISEGQPVGSRALSQDADIDLSPATIRNVMADLEDMGLVNSPHTSSGRVPTTLGYRLFVNSLLTIKPIEQHEVERLQNDFDNNKDAASIIADTSKLLSEVTHMAGVVTLPRHEVLEFRHIEFLPLSNSRILVIFVGNEKEVHNKIINASSEFSPAELQQAANYLNAKFKGKSLADTRQEVLKDMKSDHENMNRGMINAIAMAQQVFQNEPSKEDYILSGETNLMDFSELSDISQLRSLFDAFSQKRSIIHLLDQCLEADGVQIYIGKESGYQVLSHCSLVASSYSVNNEAVGVLGVIGPTRMAYEKIIPFVDITAKLLGVALDPTISSNSGCP